MTHFLAKNDVASKMISLNKKYDRFKWTMDCQGAFDSLKKLLTALLLLTYPGLSKPMVLYTNASDQCTEAVLKQQCLDRDVQVLGVPEELTLYFLFHMLPETRVGG